MGPGIQTHHLNHEITNVTFIRKIVNLVLGSLGDILMVCSQPPPPHFKYLPRHFVHFYFGSVDFVDILGVLFCFC